jgi:hypothetical protein
MLVSISAVPPSFDFFSVFTFLEFAENRILVSLCYPRAGVRIGAYN